MGKMLVVFESLWMVANKSVGQRHFYSFLMLEWGAVDRVHCQTHTMTHNTRQHQHRVRHREDENEEIRERQENGWKWGSVGGELLLPSTEFGSIEHFYFSVLTLILSQIDLTVHFLFRRRMA